MNHDLTNNNSNNTSVSSQDTAAIDKTNGSAQVSAPATGKTNQETGSVPQQKNPFHVPEPVIPTQEGPFGIRYDFNYGARILLPKANWKWHAQIEDASSDNILFACDAEEGYVISTKKYYVPFRLRVWIQGQPEPVFVHEMKLEGKPVMINFPVGTIGDIIGWMSYAVRFARLHKCTTEFTLSKVLADIFRDQYPDIRFTSLPDDKPVMEKPYATYRLGLFFKGDTNHQPIDFRQTGLHRTAAYILGVDPMEEAPKVRLGSERVIKERYVTIATKSSSQAKFWNNGGGWEYVVSYLKSIGYRVLCIDREAVSGRGHVWNRMPHDAEDFTGNLPLQERIALIEHSDFFIGLSSGLSWLAWCTGVPVVMISGFTLPTCEFYTPYRVFSPHGCNGCWDDLKVDFDHFDYFWCPRHKNTDRQFECTRLITGKQVVTTIKQLMYQKGLERPDGKKDD